MERFVPRSQKADMTSQKTVSNKTVTTVDRVVIRFAGDSGDGMQLTGDRFTAETAAFGNDLSTLPNFPAEIRAPAGTMAGVSSFQLHFADHDILTPGDAPDVLVAMNPAALKANLPDLPKGATIIADSHDFTTRNLTRVGYETNPLLDDSLVDYQLQAIDLTGMTVEAVKEFGLSRKDASRSKNMFALGLLSWMYNRPTEGTETFFATKFANKPAIRDANLAAFRAGHAFGETTEVFAVSYEVKPAQMRPGTYRNITGNLALAYGLIAASWASDLPLFLGSYPITPASDVLHELSKHKNLGVTTVQAEDEIAGIGAALGAAFGGALGVTTTSGPGIALKAETIGLGVMLELPMLICDIQRAGPSTGLPTKTEQADLLQVMFGRNGEAPVPVLAAQSPSDCFDIAVEAARIAVTYRTPVILLSDGYLANGSEPWHLPDLDAIEPIEPSFATEPNAVKADGSPDFHPYLRDEQTLARPWAVPGTAGLQHRVGGLEKDAQDRRRLLRPGEPRRDGAHPGREDRRHRRLDPRTRRRRPDRRREGPRSRLGLDLRADRCRRAPGPQDRQEGGAHAPAAPQPVPVEPGRDPHRLRHRAGARDEPRAAGHVAAGQVPGGRALVLTRPRSADLAERARRRTGGADRSGRGRRRRRLRAN